jgi:hypothetical protein
MDATLAAFLQEASEKFIQEQGPAVAPFARLDEGFAAWLERQDILRQEFQEADSDDKRRKTAARINASYLVFKLLAGNTCMGRRGDE